MNILFTCVRQKIWFSLVFMFLFLPLSTKASDDASHKGPELLGLKTFENLKGRFTQKKVLKDLGVEIKTVGHFQVSQPATDNTVFHWNVEKPKPSQVCMDSKNLVLQTGQKKKKIELSQVGAQTSEQMGSLLKLVSMNPTQIKNEFLIEPIKSNKKEISAAADREIQGSRFLLTPKKPESVFFKSAQIQVNSQGLVDQIQVTEKSQDELEIQFSHLQTEKVPSLPACKL